MQTIILSIFTIKQFKITIKTPDLFTNLEVFIKLVKQPSDLIVFVNKNVTPGE